MQMTLIGKNAETSVKPMSHKGEEIAVLLDGKVKLTIGKFSVVLSSEKIGKEIIYKNISLFKIAEN